MNQSAYNEYLQKLNFTRNKYREIYAHREGSLVFDGIVNGEQYKHILLLLKEANQERSLCSEPKPLNELLNENEPWEMWLRVVEWVWGITNANQESQLPYSSLAKLSSSEKHKEIKKIAVVNLNKADGIGSPKREDIDKRLAAAIKNHPDQLRCEIEAAMPRIIICGNTYDYFRQLYSLPGCDGYKDFIRADIGNNKDVLIINSCHPNAHVKSIMAYYGIVGIYREALSEGWRDEQ